MEFILGKILKDKLHSKVDLEDPQAKFQGFVLEKKFILGLSLFERQKGIFRDRGPSLRPRFHPATLTPKLARCMVNLARAIPNGLLLDPFCGVGGVLIEAGLIGCQTIGIDAKEDMCRGCLENLRFYGVNPLGIVSADALKPPVVSADHVATDPPYGTAATTMKRPVKSLITEFMPQCASILENHGYICIAAPSRIGILDIGSDAGLIPVESHRIYIHKSLTREIAVFKKGKG
jgi:tRNA (guanine10-N2)-dimethyltransferase